MQYLEGVSGVQCSGCVELGVEYTEGPEQGCCQQPIGGGAAENGWATGKCPNYLLVSILVP